MAGNYIHPSNINAKEKLNYDLIAGGIKKAKSSCSSHNKGFLIIDNGNTNIDNCSINTFHQNNSNKIDEIKNNDKKRDDIKNSKENSLGKKKRNNNGEYFMNISDVNSNKNNKKEEENNENEINNNEIIPMNEFILLINSIYESKEKEEKVNLDKGLPQKTLEYHIYIFKENMELNIYL